MSTLNRTFSVKNGIDVANTILIDSNRNLTNVGNITPTGNNTQSLGSPTAQFKDLYLSGQTMYLGGTTLQSNNDELIANTFNAAISFVSGGLNVLDQANTARTTANDAYGQANTARATANDAYGQANTARSTANDAYAQANTGYGQANDAFAQANAAYAQANSKVSKSGDTMTGDLIVTKNVSANILISSKTMLSPPSTANTTGERVRLFDFDNPGQPNYAIGVEPNHIWTATDDNSGATGFKWYGNTTQAMYLKSNGELYVSNTVNAKVFITSAGLNVTDQANNAYAAANGAANTVRVSANSGSTLSSKQLNFVNTTTAIVTVADSGDGNANITVDVIGGGAIAGAYGQANAAYAQANAAYDTANDKIEVINGLGAIDISSGAINNVVTYSINVNRASVSTVGVTKLIDATDSTDTANAATANAVNAVFDYAATKLPLSGGTISGDLTIDGNLYLSMNTTLINVSTYQVEDPLIYLASNNNISDTVDIGFMGGKNTSGVYSHTGLVRHAADDKYYLFDGLPDEAHTNNVVNVAATYLATLRANIEGNSIVLMGNTVATQANLTLAHDQANTARTTANDAYAQANTARDTANDSYAQANTARGTANDAYAQANTARNTANDAYAQANSGFGQANAAYGQANAAYGQANAAYGQANAAYGQANDAYARANTKVYKSGDTMTGQLTINTSGLGLSVGNATATYSLAVGSLNVTTNTVTTISSGQVVLDVFPTASLASAKYFVQVNSGFDYHTTEVVLLQDATNVWLTEYGSIQTGPSLGAFSADINSGDVRLLFNATNAVNTIRSVRYGIAP